VVNIPYFRPDRIGRCLSHLPIDIEIKRATAVRKDGIYEIVPLPEAKKLPSLPSPLQDSGNPFLRRDMSFKFSR